jgi:hypothetical protein
MFKYVWILGREQAVKDVPIKFSEGQKVQGWAKVALQW